MSWLDSIRRIWAKKDNTILRHIKSKWSHKDDYIFISFKGFRWILKNFIYELSECSKEIDGFQRCECMFESRQWRAWINKPSKIKGSEPIKNILLQNYYKYHSKYAGMCSDLHTLNGKNRWFYTLKNTFISLKVFFFCII